MYVYTCPCPCLCICGSYYIYSDISWVFHLTSTISGHFCGSALGILCSSLSLHLPIPRHFPLYYLVCLFQEAGSSAVTKASHGKQSKGLEINLGQSTWRPILHNSYHIQLVNVVQILDVGPFIPMEAFRRNLTHEHEEDKAIWWKWGL